MTGLTRRGAIRAGDAAQGRRGAGEPHPSRRGGERQTSGEVLCSRFYSLAASEDVGGYSSAAASAEGRVLLIGALGECIKYSRRRPRSSRPRRGGAAQSSGEPVAEKRFREASCSRDHGARKQPGKITCSASFSAARPLFMRARQSAATSPETLPGRSFRRSIIALPDRHLSVPPRSNEARFTFRLFFSRAAPERLAPGVVSMICRAAILVLASPDASCQFHGPQTSPDERFLRAKCERLVRGFVFFYFRARTEISRCAAPPSARTDALALPDDRRTESAHAERRRRDPSSRVRSTFPAVLRRHELGDPGALTRSNRIIFYGRHLSAISPALARFHSDLCSRTSHDSRMGGATRLAYQMPCRMDMAMPGTTRSSLPTLHRRWNTMMPGIGRLAGGRRRRAMAYGAGTPRRALLSRACCQSRSIAPSHSRYGEPPPMRTSGSTRHHWRTRTHDAAVINGDDPARRSR